MTRQTVLIVIAVLAVLAVLVAIVAWRQNGGGGTAPESVATEITATGEDAAIGEALVAKLYFPSSGGWLHAEEREVPASADSAARVATVVANLLAGPRGGGIRAPLPDNVTVRKVYLSADGVAFVDFESPESTPPASGSLREMLTVYSLVNTVLLNFEELDRVVLLWNSRQLRTFAGHVDTMRPLAANTGLIARPSGPPGERQAGYVE